MFGRILIANRGEIACRIIRTCRRLGIASVAVYSDADRDAPHVRLADQAVAIGPAPAAQSYLDGERILAACRATGAEAVHPGYGFLSERASFARRIEAAGIVFIGPPAEAIAALGDKIESKRLAAAAGVNAVPGVLDVVPDAESAARIAAQIGYPVMIKASAGGGGKGMRLARTPAELREGFASAAREAAGAFGDDRLFVEKFVDQPRHIEVQVLADAHGNTIHLGERECSIQRRHQKVIEEAPSPFVTPEMRAAMGAQAVALARAAGYRSAGTVEFIVDGARNFYFLEMNTRLQVEHPVTEMVTGLDLVELMIRIAAGEPLPLRQEEVRLEGWAIEARLYAEDPFRGFLPATGRLVSYRPPSAMAGVRLDDGVVEGGEISIHYDPMIGKLCAHGADREEARRRLADALDAFTIRGFAHNLPFLAAVLDRERFRQGALTTGFIAEEFPDAFHGASLDDHGARLLAAVAVVAQRRLDEREHSVAGRLPGGAGPGREWVARLDGRDLACEVDAVEGGYRVETPLGAVTLVTGWQPGQLCLEAVRDGTATVYVQIERRGIGWRLIHRGAVVEARVLPPRAAALAALMPEARPPDLSRFVLSPMPGLLVSLAVAEGQEVKDGEVVAVIEAMKMENLLRAGRDGVVAKLHVHPGESVAVDQPIVEFAP